MSGSLAFRAALAVTLMIVYIGLAVGAVVGLAAIGIALLSGVAESGRASLWLVVLGVACLVAAAVIVWSMFPRIDRFVPPGPELAEADHPELFAELRRVSEATGEALPRHVYVMWDINAFVAQRGGIMGFGSRRVMGLGLPLMRVLTVSELRAVLAHEMGHFYGGDTRLGPWVYKTRAAIGRTIVNLARAADGAAHVAEVVHLLFVVILAPFKWFGVAFMRITQAISRAQELGADRVAARCEGVAPLVEGLKKTHAGALAHELYMRHELLPIVEDGALPPAGEGFSRFMTTELVTKLLDDVVEGELREGTSDPYDSHPPLRERIAALSGVEGATVPADGRPSIELVAGAGRIEDELIGGMLAKDIKRVRWDDVPAIWEQRWRKTAAKLADEAGDLTIASIPADKPSLHVLCRRIEGEELAARVDDDSIVDWARSVIGVALCIALVDAGFAITADVGAPVVLRKGDQSIEPIVELGNYLRGELGVDAWRARWAALGLADHRFSR